MERTVTGQQPALRSKDVAGKSRGLFSERGNVSEVARGSPEGHAVREKSNPHMGRLTRRLGKTLGLSEGKK